MPQLNNKRVYFFSGLIAIVLIYSIYNLFVADASYYLAIPQKLRHISRLAAVLAVYGIGTFALHKYTVKWMMQIWHLIHIAAIAIIVLIGLYYWGAGMISYQLRNIANSLTELLISPALYVGMGILNSRIRPVK